MAILQRSWKVGFLVVAAAGAVGGGVLMADEQPKVGGGAGRGGSGPVSVPKTEVRPVEETIFGRKLVDNYRWLEGDNSDPNAMGSRTTEVDAWTEAQNNYTRSVLDNLPGRKAARRSSAP